MIRSPEPLLFEVTEHVDEAGRKWIHLSSSFECKYRLSMEDLIATLWDFPNYPKIFSRVAADRLMSDTGTQTITEQRTVVSILGLSFVAELRFKTTLTRWDADVASVDFVMTESDGSCLSNRGSWEMEDISDESGPLTRLKYSIDSDVASRFPGQAEIMRIFGAADVKKAMTELGVAAAARKGKM